MLELHKKISRLTLAAVSLCLPAAANAITLDWTVELAKPGSGWALLPDGRTAQANLVNIGGSTINATATVVLNDAGTVVQTTGGLPDFQNGGVRLFYDHVGNDPEQHFGLFTLEFSTDIAIDSFAVRDIDSGNGGGSSFADGVRVRGLTSGGVDVPPNDLQFDASTILFQVGNQTVYPFNPDSPVYTGTGYTDPISQLDGAINTSLFRTFELKHFAFDATRTPTGQAIVIDDMEFFEAVPVEITKSSNPPVPVAAGDTVPYTIEVTNNRPAVLTGIEVEDVTSNGVTYTASSTVASTPVSVSDVASDDFSSGNDSGGTGWDNNWQTVGDATIRAAQQDLELSTAALFGFIGTDGEANRRVADALDGASTVTLSFDLDTTGFNAGDELALLVSNDGTTGGSTVFTYVGNGFNGTEVFDISALVGGAGQTVIEFVVDSSPDLAGRDAYIDNIEITAEFGLSKNNGPGPDFLVDGTPPAPLVAVADGFTLGENETLTVTYDTTADTPLPAGIINLASVTTAEWGDPRFATDAISTLVPLSDVAQCSNQARLYPVLSGSDDGWFRNGEIRLSDSYFEMGNDETNTWAVVRFQGVSIPLDSTINSAQLFFTASDTSSGAAEVDIFAIDAQDAPAWGGSNVPPAFSPGLNPEPPVNWVIPNMTSVGQVEAIEVTDLVQSVLDDNSGIDGAIAFALRAEGAVARFPWSFEGQQGGQQPILSISFDCPPTLVTLGEVSLESISISDYLDALGVAGMDTATLAGILDTWTGGSGAQGLERAEIIDQITTYLDPNTDGHLLMLRWLTLAESGTLGFYVERREPGGAWQQVNERMMPSLLAAPMGGEYLLIDPQAEAGVTYEYRLIEIEARGSQREYGPFSLGNTF